MSRGSIIGTIWRAVGPFLALLVSATIFAQGERGALNGIITDQNSAVVAGAGHRRRDQHRLEKRRESIPRERL